MSKELTILARIESKQGKIDFVKAEALKLLEPTRREKGCIKYNLHQDNEHPEVLIFFEIWESAELWKKHMENEHLKIFIEATNDSLTDLAVNQLSLIN